MSAPTGGLSATVHAPSGGAVQELGNCLTVTGGTLDKSYCIYIYMFPTDAD